jgi:thiol-disulfide isomerase/thioredoxin
MTTDSPPSTHAVLRWVVMGVIAAATLAAIAVVPAPNSGPPAPRIIGAIQYFSLLRNPRPVPEAAFTDAKGARLDLSAFRGKVVLVNFWATWCLPCRREMPSLDRLEKRLGGARFAVVALSGDRTGNAVVKPFFDEIRLKNLAIYLDRGGDAQRAFGVVQLPTSILIDRQGREVGRLAGPAEWDSSEAVALIRHFMWKGP